MRRLRITTLVLIAVLATGALTATGANAAGSKRLALAEEVEPGQFTAIPPGRKLILATPGEELKFSNYAVSFSCGPEQYDLWGEDVSSLGTKDEIALGSAIEPHTCQGVDLTLSGFPLRLKLGINGKGTLTGKMRFAFKESCTFEASRLKTTITTGGIAVVTLSGALKRSKGASPLCAEVETISARFELATFFPEEGRANRVGAFIEHIAKPA